MKAKHHMHLEIYYRSLVVLVSGLTAKRTMLRFLLSAEGAIPVAVAAAAVALPSVVPYESNNEKVKRVCLYKIPKPNNDAIDMLEETVEKFNKMDGIKATFHHADPLLAKEHPELKSSHSHCLLIIAKDIDCLLELVDSDLHNVRFAKQLLAAGASTKDAAIHAGPLTVIS